MHPGSNTHIYAIHSLFPACPAERLVDSSAAGQDCPRQEHRRQPQRAQAAAQAGPRAGRHRRLLRLGHRSGLRRILVRLLRVVHRRGGDDDYALHRNARRYPRPLARVTLSD